MKHSLFAQRRPRPIAILGAVLLAGLGIQCQKIATKGAADAKDPSVARAADTEPVPLILATVDEPIDDPLEEQARRDPLKFLRGALEHYRTSVRDYRCTFVKIELVNGRYRAQETTRVLFMEEPFSVLMSWDARPRPAQRVLFIEDKWTDSKGRAMALVHPEPLLALIAPRLKRPINDRIAMSRSRRQISEFGFGRSLELLIKYSEIALARGELKLEYKGRSSVKGRPSYVFVRNLPYAGEDGPYPDRVAIVHLDKEWLVPVSIHTYSDDAETKLLGRYLTTDVELNVGLSPADFTLD